MNISTASTVYVQVPVSANVDGIIKDPTADPVQMAFVVGNNDPQESDWHPASWQTGTTTNAICLVGPGPGGVVLAAGNYSVWVKIVDSPEIPVLFSGYLSVV